jgi:hypothetical protein
MMAPTPSPAATGGSPFTVRDPAVAAEVNAHLGNRVTLAYEQHLGLPSRFGETEYFAEGGRRAQPQEGRWPRRSTSPR